MYSQNPKFKLFFKSYTPKNEAFSNFIIFSISAIVMALVTDSLFMTVVLSLIVCLIYQLVKLIIDLVRQNYQYK